MVDTRREGPGHVVILGAGPAGLAVGHELSVNGSKVTVLERNDYVGGLCRTVDDQGYKFDLGGHRWFTKNEDLNRWFRRLGISQRPSWSACCARACSRSRQN